MDVISESLKAHLETAHTTLCRAWQINRTDGETFAFTDHDLPLSFDGVSFKADSGLGAKALSQ
ncbi:MAG: baseplate hub protein, partial [Paracoccaceae bacterium]